MRQVDSKTANQTAILTDRIPVAEDDFQEHEAVEGESTHVHQIAAPTHVRFVV